MGQRVGFASPRGGFGAGFPSPRGDFGATGGAMAGFGGSQACRVPFSPLVKGSGTERLVRVG